MNHIETQTFKLQPNTYFKIMATNRLRRNWWMYLGYFAFALFFLKDFHQSDLTSFMVIFGFAYPPLLFGYLYYWAQSQRNQAFFMERKMVLDEDKITSIDQDGAHNEIFWKHVFRVVDRPQYWLLYIAKGQFIYLPKDIFHDETDQQTVSNLMSSLSTEKQAQKSIPKN